MGAFVEGRLFVYLRFIRDNRGFVSDKNKVIADFYEKKKRILGDC